jgi:hypothetical protein
LSEGGKGYFCEPWMVEMLDFSVVKCDLFYSCEVWLSIKMLREMRIKVSVSWTVILLCLFDLFHNSHNRHDIYAIINLYYRSIEGSISLDCTRVKTSEAFWRSSDIPLTQTCKLWCSFNWQVEKWEDLKRRYCNMH